MSDKQRKPFPYRSYTDANKVLWAIVESEPTLSNPLIDLGNPKLTAYVDDAHSELIYKDAPSDVLMEWAPRSEDPIQVMAVLADKINAKAAKAIEGGLQRQLIAVVPPPAKNDMGWIVVLVLAALVLSD